MIGELNMEILVKLVLATVLGGLVGLERQYKNKPAGLRTNMLICLGAALFTVLSQEIAGRLSGDAGRIASQVIPGIGFIGAGAIIREGASVQGLTTAATIFVVASVGMAIGAGMYATAVFTTLVTVAALAVLGWIEGRMGAKGE